MRASIVPWVLLGALAGCARGAARKTDPVASITPGASGVEVDLSPIGSNANESQIEVLRKKKGEFIACYEQALAAHPGAPFPAGKLLVRFYLDEGGRVTEAVYEEDAVGDPLLAQCVLDVSKHILFPPPRVGVTQFNFPIVFKPRR
ncbi:MAG TPA: AgmX/PglI C-terminal domain-containing protein [Polyangia bacterium]|jgi:hypothetical protein|nr:AgmX/PglI C-terminal domain-containing protein [Polyangia bacterium]